MQIYFVTLLLCILSGTEVDLFIPSFPEIQEQFGLTPFMVELALGVNLVAYAASCILSGNLGDRYGRRPVMLWSLAIFVLGSVLCSVASDFWQLLLGRAMQGAGIAAPSTLAYVIISDHYPVDKQQKLLGTMNGAITLAMTFAPIVGSYVDLWFHWQGNFLLLLGFGAVCWILSYFWIPDTPHNPSVHLSLKAYLPVFKSPTALLYIALITLLVADYWTFVGIAPLLYMDSFGVPLSHYGFYQGVLALGFSVLSFSSGYWIKRFGVKPCFFFGVLLLFLYIFCALGLVIWDIRDPKIITGVLLLSSFGALFPINTLYPLMLESLPEAKGRISAVQVGGRLILAAIAIQVVSYFYDDSFRPVGIAMILMYLTAFLVGIVLFRRQKIF